MDGKASTRASLPGEVPPIPEARVLTALSQSLAAIVVNFIKYSFFAREVKRLVANLNKSEYIYLAVEFVELAYTHAVPLAVEPRDLRLHKQHRIGLFERHFNTPLNF
jgi:hypothetical protein